MDVRPDATLADLVGEGLAVDAVVLAGGAGVAAKVGASVAAVAVLALQLGVGARAHVGVADEHAEALKEELVTLRVVTGVGCFRLTGLKAVILPGWAET